MDVFGILGFTMGSTAFTFALVASTQVTKLQKQLKDLRTELVDAGVGVAPGEDEVNSQNSVGIGE